MGDLDGDGKLDLVVNSGSSEVSVLKNTSIGIDAISFAEKTDFITGADPSSIAIGDLDGDGKLDLAVTNQSDNNVSVLRNTGAGPGTITFATKLDFTTGLDPRAVAIGDLNGDGKLDLLVGNSGSNTVSVLRNTSTGSTPTFAVKSDFTTGNAPYSVAIGNLDGDGKPDLAVANASGNTLSVIRNTVNTTNTAPTISDQTFATDENSAASTELGTVVATDIDSDALTFSIVSGNKEEAFALGSTSGELTVNNSTALDFETTPSFSLTVEVSDGTASSAATITVNLNDLNEASSQGVFFSEYLEGSSNNKAIEIYNGTDATIDLSNYKVVHGNNGNVLGTGNGTITEPYEITLSGSLASGEVYVIADVSANASILAAADLILSFGDNPGDRVVAFNGDDALGLYENNVLIDVFGESGVDPGSSWTVAGDGATTNKTLVRKGSITSGNTANLASFGTNADDSEWIVYDQDDFSFIGFHNVDESGGNTVPTITAFSPKSGPIGTEVTITGSGFDTTPTNNTVFFGTSQATVSTATATSLTVTVPSGATYQPITILTDGLIAYASTPFVVTFGGEGIDTNSYADKADFTTGTNPYSVAIGDLDGDGKLDLAVTNGTSNTVSVFRNTSTGIGTISYAAKVDFVTGSTPYSIAIGDLDGDGKPDLAVANIISATVSVFRNTSTAIGTITFSAKVDHSTGANPRSVAIGDLNGDGKLDLAVTNRNINTVSIFRNTSIGSGSITYATRVDHTTGTQPESVAIGDLDGDGKPDLAVANTGSNTLSVFRNTSTSDGMISYATKEDYTTDSSPWSVALGDLNGNEKLDIAVLNTGGQTISVFGNTSTGAGILSYAAKVDFTTGTNPESVAIGDLDGDGKLDLTATNGGSTTVSIFRNTSTATETVSFADKVDFATGSSPRSVAIGDLDGDGKSDLVVANLNSSNVSIFRNTVEAAVASSATDFTAFSISEQVDDATINTTDHTIALVVTAGTNLTALIPTFTLSSGAAAEVGNTSQVSATTPNNFTNPLTYTVIAEDGATTQDWVVTVTEDSDSSEIPTITSFTPTSAITGTAITITGTKFTGVTAVSFGGVSATSFDAVSATSITAVIGSGASGDVSVTTPAGTATLAGFTYTNTTPSELDYLSLVALYNSTDGANWINSWDLNADINSWHGVVVTSNRVTELNLGSNGLTGTLPTEIGNLDLLITLDVSNNSIEGTIPIELYNITSLENLYIFNNSFTGIISENIGLLTNLIRIYVGQNQLSGTIPSSFGNLTRIEQLGFTNNLFSGVIPQELSNLTALQQLYFDLNPNLTGAFPLSFTASVLGLTELKIDGTDICEPTDQSFLDWIAAISFYNTSGIQCTDLPSISDQTFAIDENSAVNTVVGTVVATAADSDALTFGIVSGNTGDAFALASGTGELTVASQSALDYETTPSFALTIQVSDGESSSTATISINLNDIDEGINNAPAITNQIFSIDENSTTNAVAGTVVASDADSDTLTFRILSGNTGNAFNIGSSSGVIRVNNSSALDFETTPSFSLSVEVSDGQATASASITINLNDVEEATNTAPTIANQTFSIDENSTLNTVVGTVVAADAESDALTFSILSGNTGNAFAIGSSSGTIRVNSSSALDFETTPSFSLSVEVSDGQATASAAITINLNDVDEASNTPPTITNQTFSINENRVTNSVVGTVSANDADSDALTFQILSGNTDQAFRITSSNGTISVDNSSALDYETIPSFNLLVEVSDGEQAASSTITIDLINIEEIVNDIIPNQTVTPVGGAGSSIRNYSIISFPFKNPNVNVLLNELGPYDPSIWRLHQYNTASSSYREYISNFSSIEAGKGYFFIQRENNFIQMEGNSVDIVDGIFTIDLAEGFNLIGNPFVGTLNWSDVIQHNIDKGIISTADFENIYLTNVHNWRTTWVLDVNISQFAGGFIKTTTSISNFEIPFSATSNSGGRLAFELPKPQSVNIDNESWDLNFYVKSPSLDYYLAGIGINTKASDGYDYLDVNLLPRFHEFLEVSFEDGITKSVKKSSSFQSWEFKLKNNLTEKSFHFSWDQPISTNRTVLLVDQKAHRIYDLSEESSATLANDPEATFQLYFGAKEDILKEIDLHFDFLNKLYPNPVEDQITARIYSSKNEEGIVKIISMDGKVVFNKVIPLSKGLNNVLINFADHKIPTGVYYFRLNDQLTTKLIFK